VTAKNFNISNVLSFTRILLVIPFYIYLVNEKDLIAISIGIVAVLTDFVDGWAARKYQLETELGKILDPIGDKLLLSGAVIALIIRGDIPFWFFVIVFSRDIIILIAGTYLKSKIGKVNQSNIWGKIAFAVTAVVVLGVIADFGIFIEYGFYVATFFLIISFISYFFVFIDQLKKIRSEKKPD
jgi:CDP-diacylglycerol--glycerol-3-phosphate 3-phosphatidyltransferase